MTKIINVAVCGALGRMGQRVMAGVVSNPGLKLCGALEREDHQSLWQDAGNLTGLGSLNVILQSDFDLAMEKADVYIDFTSPEAVMINVNKAVRKKLPAVIGTTGLSEKNQTELREISKNFPILWSPNMSLGVNLMYKAVDFMARALGKDFDLEIVEAHHRLKKDAPSGTALKLFETLAEARGLEKNKCLRTGRVGLTGGRTNEEIGVLAVRGGDIVGDHTVYFCGQGERLELTHRAHSRDTFASGAIRAASWIVGREPGFYSLNDVLGF